MIKKYLLIFCLIFVNYQGFSRDLPDFERFWIILTQLESNNNPKAIGDNGLAIGIAQIHKNYFLDAQKFDKSLINNSYSDCFDPKIAKKVVKSYLSRYCKENEDSFENWARCHNSGWNWKKKKDLTNNYWMKFSRLNKQK